MCKNENTEKSNYIVLDKQNEHWGITVTTVGYQTVMKNEVYPPQNHPEEYLFQIDKGRILNEYQLLYISNGNGIFSYGKNKQSCNIDEGKMFLLKPGVWHSYKPLENSVWKEYWIGFKGNVIQNIIGESFFTNHAPVFSIGHDDCIVDLYQKAITIANDRRAGYQQALTGILMHILGQMVYQEKTQDIKEYELIEKINKSKVIMRESVYENIYPEDIAKKLNISYSGFRRAFKKTTGTSPLKHILDLKMNEAKMLLTSSSLSIKQISYSLNFESPDYFNVFFKKRTGLTPVEYRDECHNKKSKPVFEIKHNNGLRLMNAN